MFSGSQKRAGLARGTDPDVRFAETCDQNFLTFGDRIQKAGVSAHRAECHYLHVKQFVRQMFVGKRIVHSDQGPGSRIGFVVKSKELRKRRPCRDVSVTMMRTLRHKSCMAAIMGRMACESGREITWDDALNSDRVLAPDVESIQSLSGAPRPSSRMPTIVILSPCRVRRWRPNFSVTC